MRDSALDPLHLPADFWSRREVTSALADRDFGALFRLACEETRVSQTRLGTAVDMAQGRVSIIINGKQKPLHTQTMTRIADGLGMPIHARRTLGLAPGVLPTAEYPQTADQAVTSLVELWRSDEARNQELTFAPTDPAAWNSAALAWLVSEPDIISPASQAGRAVGASDIDRVRKSTALFAELDNRFGGAHPRRSLIHFLDHDAATLLQGSYTDRTGRELFSAVAEASLLAAWTSYDCGLQGLAQRYFVHALRLAQAAGNRQLACSVLSAMSHQANYLGQCADAVNLARAASSGLRDQATPALTAQFRAMEARALARSGDITGCHAALAAAERAFQLPEPGRDPEFISYFNEAELTAEIAHCHRDLGDARKAAEQAAKAAPSDGQYARSDFFITLVLADALADQDDAAQACQVALEALSVGQALTSARCVVYLRQFRKRLARFGDTAEVRDFTEQAAGSTLWARAVAS